jgi:hypothetical protein
MRDEGTPDQPKELQLANLPAVDSARCRRVRAVLLAPRGSSNVSRKAAPW